MRWQRFAVSDWWGAHHPERFMYVSSQPGQVQVLVPAKLNLFLEILARRPDGFHEIETLMVAVSLFDQLVLEESPDPQLRLSGHWSFGHTARVRSQPDRRTADALGDLPLGPENLILRALERFRQAARITQGARVHVVKRIPSAAGLGGASSDAAAALLAANQFWKTRFSRAQLRSLAAELGSDVAFFVGDPPPGTQGAVCRGRGELIESFHAPGPLHFVIVRPATGLSTAGVYRTCQPAQVPRSVNDLLKPMQQGNTGELGKRLFNRLEEPAIRLSPSIRTLGDQLRRIGGWGQLMSGSGSSYFALCRSADHARRVAAAARSARLGSVFRVRTVALCPTCVGADSDEGEPPWKSPRYASS